MYKQAFRTVIEDKAMITSLIISKCIRIKAFCGPICSSEDPNRVSVSLETGWGSNMVYSRSCRLMVLLVNWEVSQPSSSGITDHSWNIGNRTTISLHRASRRAKG